MDYQIVNDRETLEVVCAQARQCSEIMLDTEFVRTRTFFPQLGLVQLYDGTTLSLIDPLEIEDMSAFVELLQDTEVTKVLHACGEDIEVLNHLYGCAPTPMMDTQVMAAFLGFGLSTGFASLVEHYLGVALDKSESRTDWLARPLSDKQLDYAAADVFYLLPLYQKLKDALSETQWFEAAQQESRRQVTKRNKSLNVDNAYLDVKGAWQLSPEALSLLKPLAKWRLEYAIEKDKALSFVVKDPELLDIAKYHLTNFKKMEQLGIDYRAVKRHGRTVANIVRDAEAIPEEEYPIKVERLMDKPGYKQLFKVLKDEVKKASATSGLATEFIASKKQINKLVTWVWEQNRDPDALPDLMQDWRLDLCGEKLNQQIL
ncbi:ribonuclease D [Vibrio sp.]|nr:ribonuclease D [Vibrio sp.]